MGSIDTPAVRPWRTIAVRGTADALTRYSVLVAMLATAIVFAALRPSTFLTWANIQVILIQAAPLAVVGLGLTVVMVMGDFDLSFGAVVSVTGAIAISLMAESGLSWPLAVLITLAAMAGAGIVNGVFTAYLGAQAFIVTLAAGTALSGIEYLVTDQKSIYDGIPGAYSNFAQGSIAGVSNQIYVAAGVLIVVWMLLRHTETGRRMYAVGGSPHAAMFAGIRVARLRLAGFVIAALLATLAGFLVSSDSGAYTPAAGAGFLLPAFTAVFLGSTLGNRNLFTAEGTVVGVVFLGIIQNGLILLGIAVAWVNIAQGAILLAAITSGRFRRSR